MKKILGWFNTAPKTQSDKFLALKKKYGFRFWDMLEEARVHGQSKCGTIKLKRVGNN